MKLKHACRGTCSGWQDGYDQGYKAGRIDGAITTSDNASENYHVHSASCESPCPLDVKDVTISGNAPGYYQTDQSLPLADLRRLHAEGKLYRKLPDKPSECPFCKGSGWNSPMSGDDCEMCNGSGETTIVQSDSESDDE